MINNIDEIKNSLNNFLANVNDLNSHLSPVCKSLMYCETGCYRLEYGYYNDIFLYVLMKDNKILFSIGNSSETKSELFLEFYSCPGTSYPDILIPMLHEITSDCYFNLSTVYDFHNVPFEFVKDAMELYDGLKRQVRI